jgi:hypothetical protein
MKRVMIFLGIIGSSLGLLWWIFIPSKRPLHVASSATVFGIIDFPATQGLTTSTRLLPMLALLATPEARSQIQNQLSTKDSATSSVEFGFSPDFVKIELLSSAAVFQQAATKTLSSTAILQLGSTPHGYLLLRAEPSKSLLTSLPPRRWMGNTLREIIQQANATTVVLGESDDHRQAIVSLALEFTTADQAEAALNTITRKSGDFDSLGFVAQPGARSLTRQSHSVVIRLAIDREFLDAAGR